MNARAGLLQLEGSKKGEFQGDSNVPADGSGDVSAEDWSPSIAGLDAASSAVACLSMLGHSHVSKSDMIDSIGSIY